MLILLWCLPSLSMLGAHASFEWRKRSVLQTDAAQARSLGRHFVVGYSSFPEIAVLAEKGLISGVYITRHNIAGSSAAHLKEEIAALQEKVELLPTAQIALNTMLISEGIYLSNQRGQEVSAEEVVQSSKSTAMAL